MKYVMRSLNDYTNCILPRVVYAYEVTCGHGGRTFGNFDRSNFSLLECRSWEAKLRDVIMWSSASSALMISNYLLSSSCCHRMLLCLELRRLAAADAGPA